MSTRPSLADADVGIDGCLLCDPAQITNALIWRSRVLTPVALTRDVSPAAEIAQGMIGTDGELLLRSKIVLLYRVLGSVAKQCWTVKGVLGALQYECCCCNLAKSMRADREPERLLSTCLDALADQVAREGSTIESDPESAR